jgi:hypothetical protein
MFKLAVAIAAFMLPILTFAHEKKAAADFSGPDSIARVLEYNGDINELTHRLTTPFTTEELKTRAIFRWITEHIDYDYKDFNQHFIDGAQGKSMSFRYRTEEEFQAKKTKVDAEYIEHVLRKGKAICEGYSRLFQKMCEIAGIKAIVITGYSRGEYYQVGTAGSLNHAWNAVRIDSVYRLLDVTWAAGTGVQDDNGRLLSYHKEFHEYYWLTPADLFARDHFPADTKWTLLSGYTKEQFAANPYYDVLLMPKLRLLLPTTGMLSVKKGDTVRFKIEYRDTVKDIQINSNLFRNPDLFTVEETSNGKHYVRRDPLAEKKQQYIAYNHTGNLYEFQYVVPDDYLEYLDIMFDHKRVMRFKVAR